MREKKRKITNALLVLCSIMVVLVAVDFLVWVYKPKVMNDLTLYQYRQADPVVNHSFVPGGHGIFATREFRVEYRINSFGLRDREYSRNKPAGTYRILVLGDSYTEGFGLNIEQSFPKQMELLLNGGVSHGRYEVLNAGSMSYSPILEYLLLKDRLLCLSPDMVVLYLDGSDIQDDYKYSAQAVFKKGLPVAVPSTGMFVAPRKMTGGVWSFLKEHSALYLLLSRSLERIREGSKNSDPLKDVSFGDIKTDRLFFLRDNAVDVELHWARTRAYLALINDLLQERGIPFVLAIYPYAIQIDPWEWPSRKDWGFKTGKVYSSERFLTLVHAFAKEEKVPVVDLFGGFRVEKVKAPGKKLYFDYDGHWNASGSRLAAELSVEQLQPLLEKKQSGKEPGARAGI